MKTTFIYVLLDPITNQIRYVGKSNNPKTRLNKHIRESNNNKTHKENWIKSLLSKNIKPLLEIIDEVPEKQWSFWEIYWISQFKTWGFNLVNTTSGGEGSDGFKGKKHSKETIEKCRIASYKSKKTILNGEKNGRCKLKDYQIEEIKNKVLLNISKEEIAIEYGINKKYIYQLLNGYRRKTKNPSI